MFKLETKADLHALIEEGIELEEEPHKQEVICRVVLTRNDKFYMLTYMRHYYEGIDLATANIAQVARFEVKKFEYVPIPGAPVIYPGRAK
jgi:hypothetical protein